VEPGSGIKQVDQEGVMSSRPETVTSLGKSITEDLEIVREVWDHMPDWIELDWVNAQHEAGQTATAANAEVPR
jgi:hypothetical protein